jgi:hypothetical protein
MKRRGAFLVELVIIIPILLLLLAWIFMNSQILHKKQVLLIAARAGAQYAVTPDQKYGKTMALAGVWAALKAGKENEVINVVKEVLKRNGLNPDKAKIEVNWLPIPLKFAEANVKNPGKEGRATVHALYTDMSAERNHYDVIRRELEKVFDKNKKYRYTKYRIPSDIWLVQVRIEYPFGKGILSIINPILKATGYKGELNEGVLRARAIFPAPMPFVHIVAKTPPLYKALFDVRTWTK